VSDGVLPVPDDGPTAPSLAAAPWREARCLREPWRRWRARRRLAALGAGDGAPVLVLPGMHVGDWSTRALRRCLAAHGFAARGWGLGCHRADVAATLPRALARLEEVAAESGRAVALVGWSLGGVIARELARLRPDLVKRVITLGTPVVGGPRYTAVAYAYRSRGLAEIERLVEAAGRVPIRVPVTAVWSRRDGIVAWRACVDETTPGAENVEVGSSHWGLGLDPDVLALVLERLLGAVR
jgi:alpha-beta hydrolase superfamily lysophospholipase